MANTIKWFHKDHGVPAEVLAMAEALIAAATTAAAGTPVVITFPTAVEVPCGLYGPAAGDAPVPETEVRYEARNGRPVQSRLIARDFRPVREATVVGMLTEDGSTVLVFTCYGGAAAPREPGDSSLTPEQKAVSTAWWAVHALVG